MNKLLTVAISLLSIVGAVAVLYFGFTIRQVECLLNNHQLSSQATVCAQLQQLVGSRLFFRDFYQDKQIAGLLYVDETKESYDIQTVAKSLAGRVTFTLTDRPPLYRIERAGHLVLITAAGGIRENNDQLTVPLVTDSQTLYKDQPEIVHHFLAAFLEQLGEERTKVANINLVSENRLEITVPGFPTVLTELGQNPQQAAQRLGVIIRQLRPDEIDLALQELDLRFELPVLRTYQSSESAQVLIDSQE